MNITEYIKKLDINSRNNVINELHQFGKTEEVINYIDKMPTLVRDKYVEASADAHFIVLHTFRSIGCAERMFVYDTHSIKYCFYCAEYGENYVGIMNCAKSYATFTFKRPENAIAFYNHLCHFINGFNETKSLYAEHRFDLCDLRRYQLTINSSCITQTRNGLFGKKEKVIVSNIQDIVCCKQGYSTNIDFPNEFCLTLFLRNGKRYTFNSSETFSNRSTMFLVALAIKDNVPHLIYGKNN